MMKVKQFMGITYEEHTGSMFGDYVKISLQDWVRIQKALNEYHKSKEQEKEKLMKWMELPYTPQEEIEHKFK